MKPDMTIRLLDLALIVFSIILLILAVPFVLSYLNNNGNINEIQDVVNSCRKPTLQESGSCAVEITSNFYKYNLDNLGKDLSFPELKEQGSVCSAWSDYYNEVGSGLGYETKNVLIKVSGNVYHEFNVWSNEDTYCIFDQTKISCFNLSKS